MDLNFSELRLSEMVKDSANVFLQPNHSRKVEILT